MPSPSLRTAREHRTRRRGIGIGITRRSPTRSDRDEGRREPWLRTLDRLGLGFGS
ncbi:hypothetical protein ABZ618_20615 [Streptomyces roseolus]|uniref:hypothetical protein n=1 Tax=Streptomyces roseolus TaxID=67358 RepID=UPI00340E23C0